MVPPSPSPELGVSESRTGKHSDDHALQPPHTPVSKAPLALRELPSEVIHGLCPGVVVKGAIVCNEVDEVHSR